MLTPNGGVFGRNPTFNNVTVENNLTVNGDFTLGDDIVINDTLLVNGQATFRGGIISIPNSAAPTSNTVIGSGAGAAMQAGAVNNVFVGDGTGKNVTTSDYNTVVGSQAGYMVGASNTIIGCNSLANASSASNNVVVGAFAAQVLGNGNNNNTAVGTSALALASVSDLTAVGANALDANTTGTSNVAVGKDALGANTTGSNSVAIGDLAGASNTTANQNVFIGSLAGNVVTGGSSILIGAYAGTNALTSAVESVVLGRNSARLTAAGATLTTITDSILIGSSVRANDNSQTNQIVIGNSAIGNGSNTTTIGNSSTTATHLNGPSTFSVGANGQATQLGQATTLLSGLTGATVTATNLIPANCILLGVTARVTTAVTGATTFDIGDGTTANRFGDDIAIALGTTANNCIAPALITAATNVVLTANGSNFTGGAVRLTAHFMALVAPTS